MRFFVYNFQGLLTAVTNWEGREREIVCDRDDRPWLVTDERGVTVTNLYDALGRLASRGYPDDGLETFLHSARGLIAQTNKSPRNRPRCWVVGTTLKLA